MLQVSLSLDFDVYIILDEKKKMFLITGIHSVWMRAQKKVPMDKQYCRDKFLVQGIVVDHGTSVTSEMVIL